MDWNEAVKLIASLGACFAAAGIGSMFTVKSIPVWYAGLKKPPFTPPNQIFGPVWTVLYILMGISLFLIWQKGLSVDGVLLPFILFWIQLALNALWSIVFFGLKSKGGGIVVIAVLWLLILATIITSLKISVWSGFLLIPYILWVTVASYLTIGIWRLNRSGNK